MDWLVGDAGDAWQVAAKAALMYLTALVALRLGERRTLAQWTLIDFATAVAVGAVVGRTAVAKDQSYLIGAAALVTFVLVHRLASLLRFNAGLGKLMDHRVRVLVADGSVRSGQLRRCGLTHNDLYSQLRQRGVLRLADVRYVFYESKGSISVVRRCDPREADDLVEVGLRDAVEVDDLTATATASAADVG